MAQKLIAMKWICPGSPIFEEWRTQVNDALLKEWQVYKKRGLANKFREMWKPWLMLPGLTPFILGSDGSISVNIPSTSYRVVKE